MMQEFKKTTLPRGQTLYSLYIDGVEVSEVDVQYYNDVKIYEICSMETMIGHERKGYMGRLLEYVRDDLLARMKPDEYIVAKPVVKASEHLLQKYFAPLRPDCRFCDKKANANVPHSCEEMTNWALKPMYSLSAYPILQTRPQSVELHKQKEEQAKRGK